MSVFMLWVWCSWSPTEKPGVHIFQQEKLCFCASAHHSFSAFWVPNLLLQPHRRQCILKVYDIKYWKWRWRGERERCKDNPSRTSYPERRMKKPIIHKWGTVQIQYRLKFMVTWNGNKVPSLHCCDPSGVCPNVFTGDILNVSDQNLEN